ncbi:MAG TPA: transcriptional repressor [Anaerolineae bacterium]|nr:transcriptional repressor [Anaerolineae bacterium]
MRSVESFIRLFREQGLKITPQRRLIFGLLAGDDTHPTAEEVYRRVRAVMPEVSRTTVYNTLRELVALGGLAPVDNLSKEGTRYDTNTDHHHHLFCAKCHALVDIDRDFEGIELPQEEAKGFRLVDYQVTFFGYCPDCQAD